MTPTDRAAIVENLEAIIARHEAIPLGWVNINDRDYLHLISSDIVWLARAIVTALPDANEPDS